MVGIHTGNHAGYTEKCRECRNMLVKTVFLLQKSHLCRELSPCKEHREYRYMGVVGTHAGKCRECRYMVVGT